MKKNKLYTANRWNQPAFMKDKNLYALGDFLNKTADSIGGVMGGNNVKPAVGNLIGGLGTAVGQIGGNLIGGGLNSGAGNTISSVGSTVGTALSSVNPVLGGIVSVGSGLIGGLANRMFGTKVDQAKLNAANEGTAAYNTFNSNAASFDEITGPVSQVNVQDAYSGGWFSSGKAARKNDELRQRRTEAMLNAGRSIRNNIGNIADDQMNNALANYSAFGGPVETGDMGAIDYGFMTDYLTQKKEERDMKNKMGGMVPMPVFMPNNFAIGGDLQTNGGDFSDGLTIIGAGGSHEENPNEGVQLGLDSENVPNLVEEGETIFNDYVFSARIPIDQTTKEMFHIGKKREMTYADLSKKLEKEIAERVNDPISKAGFEKQMEMLEEQQERQKQEMEAERAKAAFEALSPEEQTALMQQKAEQEAMAQQQAMAEQQAAMQRPTPEEIDMVQQQVQQMQQVDGSEAALGQEPQINCFGGKINRFDNGGPKNSGKFKDEKADNWGIFTRPGLEAFIEGYRNRLNMAETEEQKKAIRKEAMDEFNAIQKGYADIYQDSSSGNFEYSDAVKRHQMNFDKAKGNTGFYSRDDAGNVRNLIAEAIDMPKGHATDDKPDSWYDGYWGPRTSIRNFGSTAYGNEDYYKPLVDEFRELGLTYAPNAEWKHGDNMLYGLSMAEAPTTERPADWTPEWQGNNPQTQVVATPSPQPTTENGTSEGTKNKGVIPDLKKETSFGLFGPAIGLGLMGLGVGKPDVASYDAAASGTGNYTTANWKPLGNYLTYRPLDIWYEQNALNAQSRATDRALVNNSGGNRGTAMAGLLANGYNSQLASGNLFRQAQEYNDNLRKQVADFNRGTDQFNSEQYGATSRFNASAYNDANRASAQMKLHAAQARDDANRWWASNLYGNINGLFDNINQWEKWKRDHNTVAKMAANGVFGVGTESTPVFGGYVKEDKKGKRSASNGGKLKKKRGLTI